MSVNSSPTASQQNMKNLSFQKNFISCRFSGHQFSFKYLREIFVNFEIALNVYTRALGKLIHEKNLKSKISCQAPFNLVLCTAPSPASHLSN